MRANFSELTYEGGKKQSCCASESCAQTEPWLTAERIPVKGGYSARDLEGMEHLNYAAALAAPKAPDLPPDYLALDPELPRWKERLGL